MVGMGHAVREDGVMTDRGDFDRAGDFDAIPTSTSSAFDCSWGA